MFDEAAPRRRKQRLDPGGLTTGHLWEGCRWLPLTRHALNWFPEYGGAMIALFTRCGRGWFGELLLWLLVLELARVIGG
jgi:hypothetical protein